MDGRMNHEIGQHPGTTWKRIDIQCHTPRDRDWRGSPDLPGGDPASEAARQSWATDFVQAAVDKGLSVIAVSDHHDVAFLPYVIEAAHALPSESRIVVLPGIEITCRDSVQCLAIFDPASTAEHWQRLLSKLPNVSVTDGDMAKTGETQQSGLASMPSSGQWPKMPFLASSSS
jgi:chromosome segregation protein